MIDPTSLKQKSEPTAPTKPIATSPSMPIVCVFFCFFSLIDACWNDGQSIGIFFCSFTVDAKREPKVWDHFLIRTRGKRMRGQNRFDPSMTLIDNVTLTWKSYVTINLFKYQFTLLVPHLQLSFQYLATVKGKEK